MRLDYSIEYSRVVRRMYLGVMRTMGYRYDVSDLEKGEPGITLPLPYLNRKYTKTLASY